MREFQRTYSRMYWTNYWTNRTYLLDDRNSSRSQDSGFSDSESSSSPPPSTSYCTDRAIDEPCQNENRTSSNSSSNTPKTPVPRPGRLTLRRNSVEVPDESEESNLNSDSVSRYPSVCHYELTNAQPASTNYLVYNFCSTAANPSRQSRSCFIVDEIPKKTVTNTAEIITPKCSIVEENAEFSSSTSFDGFKSDDTVRFVEKKENEPYRASDIKEAEKVEVSSDLREIPTSAKIKSNENRLSNVDLSRLPEPTFTSTPKKEEINTPKKINNTLTTSPFVTTNDDVKTIDSSVGRWLFELQFYFEEECTRMVQCKTIAQNNRLRRSDILIISESVSTGQTFQQKTKLIARKFSKLYEKINLQLWHLVEPLITNLAGDIKEFIVNYSQLLPQMELMDKENALSVMNSCDHLVNLVKTTPNQMNLSNGVHMLERFFSRFVGSILVQKVLILFSALEQSSSETTLLNALYGISNLDMNSSCILDIVTRLEGIQKLLSISWQSNSSQVRKAALRALEIVCQHSASIKQLEMAGGIEILSDMLTDINRDENELCEVVSLLVQITAPWIEDDHVLRRLIYYLYSILNAITHLISSTNSCETLLLCSAVLANIIPIEPKTLYILVKLNTVGCLLTAVRRLGVRASIFLLDQVATVVAGMTADARIGSHLSKNRVVGALLCFLQVKHTLFEKETEIAAAERVQHKTAVALSRLCTSPEICQQIVDLQGVSRLVHLCKDERERNYNDGLLVACLTSLRKITANCGCDLVTSLNDKELVEPKLVDSFLLYSSRKESYV